MLFHVDAMDGVGFDSRLFFGSYGMDFHTALLFVIKFQHLYKQLKVSLLKNAPSCLINE